MNLLLEIKLTGILILNNSMWERYISNHTSDNDYLPSLS